MKISRSFPEAYRFGLSRYPQAFGLRRALCLGVSAAAVFGGGMLSAAADVIPPPVEPLSVAATGFPGVQPPALLPDPAEAVSFTADSVGYDETGQIITALGNVEITQAGKTVRADSLVYNLPADKVEAVGHVEMTDENGDVHLADRAELQQKLKDGYVKKLRSVLADGSRFAAEEGQKNGGVTTMKRASYTPCEPCKLHPEKAPLWQIVADEVRHDEENHSVSYEDATFQVYGVPVLYTPYFSHSDGSIKQKSGFLSPKLSLSSQLGFGLTSRYYWGLSPSEDATIGARVFSKSTPQLFGEYRKRFDAAELDFDGSLAYSKDEDKLRGHLFGTGLWDVNEKWRAGFSTQLTSDDRYLREYDVSSDDVLENQIYAERFDDRDYAVIRALAFQDVRVSNRSADQPNIMPETQVSFVGAPNQTFGGRWMTNFSTLSLIRKGNGQDVQRGTAELAWDKRTILPLGLVNDLTLSARGDVYTVADGATNTDGASFRFYPYIHDVVSYPLVNRFESSQMVIEPTVAFTASTNAKNNTDIPNEDSQDVQIDTNNIFTPDRFPGKDKIEDRSHVTYGLRTGLYGDEGSKGEIFLGQSYRFENSDNPFPGGSGLSAQASDIVGQLIAEYRDLYSLNYRFQLGAEDFRSERHEIDGFVDFGDLKLSGTYLYSHHLDGTDLQDSRQQIYGHADYSLNENWVLGTSARYDLNATAEGLRSADVRLAYLGQCFNVETTAKKNFSEAETGDNATEIMIQLGLKNLGTFGTGQ